MIKVDIIEACEQFRPASLAHFKSETHASFHRKLIIVILKVCFYFSV